MRQRAHWLKGAILTEHEPFQKAIFPQQRGGARSSARVPSGNAARLADRCQRTTTCWTETGSRFGRNYTDVSRTGIVEIVILPLNENKQPKSAQTELLRQEIDRLFVILGFSFPEDIDHVAPGEVEGVPVSITIHRREPYSCRCVECDLASWLGTRNPGPPVVEIGRVLMDAQERALPTKR